MRFEFLVTVDVKPTTKYAEIDPKHRKTIEKDLGSQIQRVLGDPSKEIYYEDITPLRQVKIEGCTVHFYNVAPMEPKDSL